MAGPRQVVEAEGLDIRRCLLGVILLAMTGQEVVLELRDGDPPLGNTATHSIAKSRGSCISLRIEGKEILRRNIAAGGLEGHLQVHPAWAQDGRVQALGVVCRHANYHVFWGTKAIQAIQEAAEREGSVILLRLPVVGEQCIHILEHDHGHRRQLRHRVPKGVVCHTLVHLDEAEVPPKVAGEGGDEGGLPRAGLSMEEVAAMVGDAVLGVKHPRLVLDKPIYIIKEGLLHCLVEDDAIKAPGQSPREAHPIVMLGVEAPKRDAVLLLLRRRLSGFLAKLQQRALVISRNEEHQRGEEVGALAHRLADALIQCHDLDSGILVDEVEAMPTKANGSRGHLHSVLPLPAAPDLPLALDRKN
mmetsp:Transcript_133718/g.285927  ORF Transcript_133718/g.285927 Transcript_133718/m.285927 type:complete len:359 (-) Transcript_133718:335-1411(-)